jgi:hypothetical protein
MKKILFLFALPLLFVSCKKDSKQIKTSWLVQSVTIGGIDKTADYTKNAYTETYGDNDNYSYVGDPVGGSGSGKYVWDGKTMIKRNGVSGQSSMDLTVTTLTNKEFVYTSSISGEKAEFKFKKK